MAPAPIEDTLIIFKPDAVQRGLVAPLLERFERVGLTIVAMKMIQADEHMAETHYDEHKGKEFFPNLIALLTRGPSIAMVLRGRGAVAACRKIRGNTDPAVALPGTICGDFAYALVRAQNLVHASSDIESAEREIALWFDKTEIMAYQRFDDFATTDS
jgi:nucleoside-diphosphate kinase